jgi:hypothetical protein
MADITKVERTLKLDAEKVLDVISKIIMPVLLLVLGTWFNYANSSNQDKQRAQDQKIAEEQAKSVLVESYIKHLTSSNPTERQLALQIMTLQSDQFDVSLVNLVSAYAAVAPPSERITALEALNHASQHSKDTAVRAAATRNITTLPQIPVTDADPVVIQQKAAAINNAIDSFRSKPNILNKALDQLHLFK